MKNMKNSNDSFHFEIINIFKTIYYQYNNIY